MVFAKGKFRFRVPHVVKIRSLCKPIYIYSKKGLLMLASTRLLLVVVLVVLYNRADNPSYS